METQKNQGRPEKKEKAAKIITGEKDKSKAPAPKQPAGTEQARKRAGK